MTWPDAMWILLGPAPMVKQVTEAAGHQYAGNHQRAPGQNARTQALAEQQGAKEDGKDRNQIDERGSARTSDQVDSLGIPGEGNRRAEQAEKDNAAGAKPGNTPQRKKAAFRRGGQGQHDPAAQAAAESQRQRTQTLGVAPAGQGIGSPGQRCTHQHPFSAAETAGKQAGRVALSDDQQAATHREHDAECTPRRHRDAEKQPVCQRDEGRYKGDNQCTAPGFNRFQGVEEAEIVEKDTGQAQQSQAEPVGCHPARAAFASEQQRAE